MAHQEVQAPKKRQFLFNPLKRPMPYIGFLIAVLIIVFQSSIRQYTANLVGGWLVSNIRESTEGNYLLEYDFVRFDIFTKELRIKNLDLSLDTARVDEDTYLEHNNNLIYLSTPVVVLKIRSLWDLVFHDKLAIAYVGLQEPKVRLTRSEVISATEREENQQEASNKIRSYLQELEVDSFRVVNGAIEVALEDNQRKSTLNFKIGDFSTLLKGFKLENIDTTKLFHGIYAEEFELELMDQELSLPQFKHKMQFKRLWLSTSDSLIELDTLRIRPLTLENKEFKGNIDLNQFTLSGIDFKRAYLQEELDIKSVMMRKPELDIKLSGIKSNSNRTQDWFYMLFKHINIHEFNLTEGDFNFDFGHKYRLKKFGLTIDNYRIDSVYTNLNHLKDGLKDFYVELSNSIVELPDSIHQLEIGNLHISSTDSLALVNNVKMTPISGRRSYQLYKKQGVKLISYSSAKNIILSGINYSQFLKDGKLLADTLLLSKPIVNITEYPFIKSKMINGGEMKPFLIKTMLVSNGKVKHNKRKNGQNHRSELTGLNLKVSNLYNESESKITYDTLDIQINSGFSELKEIGHTLRFKGVKSHNIRNFDITQLSLKPDSATLVGEKINLTSAFLRIRGFDQNEFTHSKTVKINTITSQQLSFTGDFSTKRNFTNSSNSVQDQIKKTLINKFYIKNADLKLKTTDSEIAINDISSVIDTLNYNSERASGLSALEFHDFIVRHGDFKFDSNVKELHLSGKFGQFKDSDSLLTFRSVNLRNGNNLNGSIRSLVLSGFHSRKLLTENALKFNYIFLEQPNIEIVSKKQKGKEKQLFSPDSLQNKILSSLSYIDFDSIISNDAKIKISSENRVTELSGLNTHIGQYRLDSLSNPINIFSPEKFQLIVDELSTSSKNDTVTVQAITLDMVNNRLFTGKIVGSGHIKENQVKVKVPGLNVSGFSTLGLFNGDLTTDSIRLSGAEIVYIAPKDLDKELDQETKIQKEINKNISGLFKKSGNLMVDTLLKVENQIVTQNQIADSSANPLFGKLIKKLRSNVDKDLNEKEAIEYDKKDSLITVSMVKKATPTHGIIRNILINNSMFTLLFNEGPHPYFNKLNFAINVDSLILDSLHRFNIYNHIYDLTVSVNNYKITLPDSLNSFSFDKLRLSTGQEKLDILGLSFTPLVSKYDYADRKGFQASWNYLHDIDVRLDKLDLFKLINNKELHIKKISTYNGIFDIFKDKTLPIPVNKRVPMPQDALKGLDLAIVIDSVEVENLRINFASRLNNSSPEGHINFQSINATVSNIVNSDSGIEINPYTVISASTKVYGQGELDANFNFDMNDENNRFIFDANLTSMEAEPFSNILEALAYVKIESGKVKSLKLQAQGDDYYALGNMLFEYNNLKVSTINKKNLKTKGMGTTISSFFANAFVVKKNNPAFKFFPREGAMYYQRDPQKIVIDYVTKTAISGLISSIGARNVGKEIKKKQKEEKKQMDEERKALKKAKRSAGD